MGKTVSGLLGVLVCSNLAVAEPNEVYFGDTHLHTALSFDAFLRLNRSADPDTAYRWAKGLPVIHPYSRSRVQINTPLDFLVVADHAESMGVLNAIHGNTFDEPEASVFRKIKVWVISKFMNYTMRDEESSGNFYKEVMAKKPIGTSPDPVKNQVSRASERSPLGDTSVVEGSAWKQTIKAAEQHYEPGKFTSLIGWEWTSTPTGANLHRVIFTPDGAGKASQFLPFGSDQSEYPEDLWRWLEATQLQTGTRFVSIPHNPNVSKGYMFAETSLEGKPITADYARRRMSWEPVTEVTQIKGDSETHPSLSPLDPFADFERYSFYLQAYPEGYQASEADFARSALKRGLAISQKIGVNPFKFGMIGSTDSHTGLASPEEANFWGKMANDSVPEKKNSGGFISKDNATGWDMSASGLAAVWANENNREEIYAAFQRKEVYATTGPRLRLRLFAGWEFSEQDLEFENLGSVGYRKGVPMGGDLSRADVDTPLQLMIRATKDPKGANLDRVQVVKGWVDASGEKFERVYNVAWSGSRKIDATGKLAAIGNTVDLKTASYSNSIGNEELSVIWADPDFKQEQSAFYYVRVLQIPTPRHSLYDAVALQETLPGGVPAFIQERAYTSPVWYTP